MTDTDSIAFDFDEWKVIASTDPERFAIMRQRFIDQCIRRNDSRAQRRLQGLQWQIDQICSVSRTPMAACIRLSGMMWDAVIGQHGLLENIQRLGAPESTQSPDDHCQQAKVIQIRSDQRFDDGHKKK